MAQSRTAIGPRLALAAVNASVFGLCYLLANAHARQRGVLRHVALPFEAGMPFIPGFILPYLSSGPLFVAAFFLIRSRDDLRVLSQRLLLATVLAAMVFVWFPLRYSTARPTVASNALAPLFDLLAAVDAPYNQLPSLHVAYCLILWLALGRLPRAAWARVALGAWLALTAVATLFVHQHHLLDVLAGLGLGLLCRICVPPGRTEPRVGLYYAVAGGVAAVVGTVAWPPAPTVYASASLWLVALAYGRGDRHFLHKRAGRHPWWIWCLYAPYLLGYRLAWLVMAWRGRQRPAVVRIAPGLWIGRRLRDAEATALPAACTVVDLAAELPETAALRGHRYLHFPLLDIVTPPADAVREIVASVRGELDAGRAVYLHCAMGLRRSVQIGQAVLARSAP
ncbi:hypothetical protein RD110_21120 [Rhodoferax koreense]|uniref:Inositolphosphotransferase Aur1/Ipt1 domain-containing protein n=1 Tax=Rhodoferax koreensis TaxID=1842727 RepID=A0A1P8K070_9BURK|nr:phosphatase PAP2 family protein [Rhodoferax koreense]APW39408.1 hypothetical protein RD110_21120 [Rhodoferax koreense]